MIIVTLRKVSCLHPPSKILLSCLACTDLGVGLISNPLYSVYLMLPEHSKGCYFSQLLSLTIGSIFCAVSLSTVTGMSVDRLLALLLGLRYKQVITIRRVKALVIINWVIVTLIVSIILLSLRIFVGIGCAMWLICIMISTFCYTKIYRTLRLSRAQVQEQPNGEGTQLNKVKYQKTVSTVLWIQMVLLACYLPFSLKGVFFSISKFNTPFLNFAWILSWSLVFSNSALNPFLYCWTMIEMRRAVKHAIRKFFCFPNEGT